MRSLIVDPVVIVLALLLTGLCLMALWRRLGLSLIVAGTLALYLLASPYVSSRLRHLAEGGVVAVAPDIPISGPPPAAIVVLSAGIYHDAPEYGGDTVDALSLERIRYAARLHRQTGLPLLATGGTPPGVAISVAEAMRASLVDDFGVPVRWLETEAVNTEENARLSAAILRNEGISTIYLVTHAAHMRRSRDAFAQAGLAVVPAPTILTAVSQNPAVSDFLPRTAALADSFYALHELAGRLWYRLAYAGDGAR